LRLDSDEGGVVHALNLSAQALSCSLGLRSPTRIERVVTEQTPITADTALRLARYIGTTAAFWLGLQAQDDLERTEDQLGNKLRKILPMKQMKQSA